MARTTPRYRYDTKLRAPRAATPLECKDDLPACPVCKGLECLCRPRFFAGQLLTEQDLNRLDHYVRAKARLHNRHLHGWGVVCGLEASCDVCGNGVRVSGGYALDPCGNDVVVCNDEIVDVCKLIEECRRRDNAGLECLDLPRDNGGCKDVEENWILAVRYVERPSRGVTALRGASCSACGGSMKAGGCSCGGSKSTGSCSCGGGTTKTCSCGAKPAARPRGAPAECEATITCESYEFVVYKAPLAKPDKDDPRKPPVLGGALVERFLCCWQGFIDAIPAPPGDFTRDSYAANPQAWVNWLADTRESLLVFFSRYPGYNCEAIGRLQCLAYPDPTSDDFPARFEAVVRIFALLALEQLFACICSALLPPCPRPALDDRIPLAVVTVRRSSCKVLRVCNWTPLRKILVTWPNVLYWLSVIPLAEPLREALHFMCCELFGLRRFFEPRRNATDAVVTDSVVAEPAPGRAQNKKQADRMKGFVALAAKAATGKRETIQPTAMLASFLGVGAGTGSPLLDELQVANPMHHVGFSHLAMPLLENAGLDRLAAATVALGGLGKDDLSTKLRDLEARVEAQAVEIEALRRHMPGGKAP
jgi:hypothetical protein